MNIGHSFPVWQPGKGQGFLGFCLSLSASKVHLLCFMYGQSGKFFCPLWGKKMSDFPEAKLKYEQRNF
jgi:hypothetical protein